MLALQSGVAVVLSRAMVGLEAVPVRVEVHMSGGLPRTTVVGLPEAAVRESKDRVRSAIMASGFDFPDARLTINLAPAELPKEGGRFDLAIALGILAVSQPPQDLRILNTIEVLGELSLDGTVRAVVGTLPCAASAHRDAHTLVHAMESHEEAARVRDAQLQPVATLLDAWDFVCGRSVPNPPPIAAATTEIPRSAVDMSDVRGQTGAKRALEVAAAGSHHLLMIGPPGTGKTMLADRLPTLLPALTEAEALETAAVYSVVASLAGRRHWHERPVRAPHHTTSSAGLIGGGTRPRPGEISLAHNGVLFLDELGEFPRGVLEALREPLESGRIVVARANAHVCYPATFQLIAAMNPCPCGFFSDGSNRCLCPPDAVRKYQTRVSGPLLDRIDIHLGLQRADRAPADAEAATVIGETSDTIRQRVEAARARQLEQRNKLNRDLDEREMREMCALDASASELLESAVQRLNLSERGVGRVRRVARTIADLAHCTTISAVHLGEAINLRRLAE